MPNYDYAWIERPSTYVGRPIDKITENGEDFYRFYLASPLTKGYTAGTNVCEQQSGGTYQYTAAGNTQIPAQWTKCSGLLKGESTDYNSNSQFRAGTKYIRILWLANYAQSGDYKLRFDNLTFKDVTRDENLITNYDASLGTTNIGKSTYTGDGVGDNVCFETGISNWTSSELIEVDSSRYYEISGFFKSIGSAGLSRLYFGVACYDENKRFIDHSSISRVKSGSTPVFTQLAHDAKVGDRYVDLVDASKWSVFYHATVNFNVDPATAKNKIKETGGSYDPVTNTWKPDGTEAYYFNSESNPRYVKDSKGAWTYYEYKADGSRTEQEGSYNAVADEWTGNGVERRYNNSNVLLYEKGKNGTIKEYNTQGQLVKLTDYIYDSNGKLTKQTEVNNDKLLFNDTFEAASSAWNVNQSLVKQVDGYMELTGSGNSWSSNFYGKETYDRNTLPVFKTDFKFDEQNSVMHIATEGTGSDGGYRRLALICGNGNIYVQYNDGSYKYPATVIAAAKTNTWYTGEFRWTESGIEIYCWEKGAVRLDKPAYTMTKTDWNPRFHSWIYRHKGYVDNVQVWSNAERNGVLTEKYFDTNGSLKKLIDPQEGSIRDYNTQGQLVKLTDKASKVTYYSYENTLIGQKVTNANELFSNGGLKSSDLISLENNAVKFFISASNVTKTDGTGSYNYSTGAPMRIYNKETGYTQSNAGGIDDSYFNAVEDGVSRNITTTSNNISYDNSQIKVDCDDSAVFDYKTNYTLVGNYVKVTLIATNKTTASHTVQLRWLGDHDSNSQWINAEGVKGDFGDATKAGLPATTKWIANYNLSNGTVYGVILGDNQQISLNYYESPTLREASAATVAAGETHTMTYWYVVVKQGAAGQECAPIAQAYNEIKNLTTNKIIDAQGSVIKEIDKDNTVITYIYEKDAAGSTVKVIECAEDVIYEDSENGNTAGWHVYDASPAGATISNVYDTDKQSKVIQVAGSGTGNGYMLRKSDYSYWNYTNSSGNYVIQWDMKYSESYTVYISVMTNAGHRYIYYTNSSGNGLGTGEYIHHGLGGSSVNGQWHTYTRDLYQDLHDAQPGLTINYIRAFLIRGSGRLDNIRMLKTVEREYDAEGYAITVTESNGAVYHYQYQVNENDKVVRIYKRNAANVLLETITNESIIDDLLYEQHLLLSSFGLYR
ncbi:MAG: hypothetical protein ABH836_01960 [Candidatus Omnitrophota bacterium]